MTERITSIVKTGATAWTYNLSGTAPYTAIKPGLTRTIYGTSFVDDSPDNDAYEPPAFEVFDSTDDATTAQNLANPAYVLVQFRGNSNCIAYRVERLIESVWTFWFNVMETGLGYYQVQTQEYEDQTTAQVRVIGRDLYGNSAPAAGVSVFMIRNPQPPRIAIAYSGGNATVSVRQ